MLPSKKFLELESASPGRFGQRSHATMVFALATVETHFADARFGGAFGKDFANRLGRSDVAAVFHLLG